MKRALISTAITVAKTSLLIAWLGYGIEPAGSLLAFWICALVPLAILLILCAPFISKEAAVATTKPAPLRPLRLAIDWACIAALAWAGHFWLASASLLSLCAALIYLQSARNKVGEVAHG